MILKTLAIVSLLFAYTNIGVALAESVDPEDKSVYPDLATLKWLHGAKSCKADTNPRLQVVQANATSYVLRQNKCVTFEAPFIYVLIGRDRVLVVDTGAKESPEESPLYETVRSLLDQQQGDNGNKAMLVVHSHSHNDHTKGDSQFSGLEGVEVVGTSNEDLANQLGLTDWPNKLASLDLGGREVTFIPIPGHQEQSIAIYDSQTGWLLTGDTFYPGLIRVKNWDIFKDSVERLATFSKSNKVSLILGAHIEMNGETKKIYSIGTKYQPKELPLGLNIDRLKELNFVLKETKNPKKLKFDDFVISPLSRFEKMLIKVVSKKKSVGE